MGTGLANPFTKRKQAKKSNHLPKKPKTVLELVVGLNAETKKMVTPLGQGKGKGFMKGPSVTKKPPVLLYEDSKYASEQLSSIITFDDYEDLSNHATEAMGETGLFNIAQVIMSIPFSLFFPSSCLVINPFFFQAMLMMKGLMGRCLNHETTLDHIRVKVNSTEDELNELKAWKTVQEKKLALSEEARDELEKQTELLKWVLEDKVKEICDTKDQLRQAKEEATHEYRDSDALLAELEGSFAKGFDDALSQVKASYHDLEASYVNIDVQAQTSVQLVHFESTYELFANDAPIDGPYGDGRTAAKSQVKPVVDSIGHSDDVQVEEEKEENTPIQQ